MYRAFIRIKIRGSRLGFLFSEVFCLQVTLCLLFSFFYGCSSIQTPDDYYQQVLEIEKNQSTANPAKPEESAKSENAIAMSPAGEQSLESSSAELPKLQTEEDALSPKERDELPSANIDEPVEESIVAKQEEAYEEPEPPRREAIAQPPPTQPIAVAPELIKIALSSAGLEINVRNLELVNGRLTGGKNSVRINFLSESIDTMDSKFVAICAVLYHLDRDTKSVDVIVGMAEDNQSNLLAIYQSDMSDVTAWMNNKLSPAEWRSRITKKVL